MVTEPQTNIQMQPQTHKQDQLQYTVPLSLACSVNTNNEANRYFNLLPQ